MDINCDLGEGMTNDAKLMAEVDSCNIACGGHAGDRPTMVETLRLAKRFGVKAGAHPSFEDRVNFGRRVVQVPLNDLKSQLIHQIAALNELAKAEGMELHHVKAHGALYHETAHSREMANILIEAVNFFKEDLCIFVPYGSVLEEEVKRKGIRHWVEVFADRNYDDQLHLLPRSFPDAVISDPKKIKERVTRMIREKSIITITNHELNINFDTICVHGDHPKALEILKELRDIKTDKN
jgi:UPF0271 protein